MTSGPITLREGSVLDLPQVMEVMDNSFEPMFGEAWTASQCAGLLPMTGVWLSLAFKGENPLGFSLARVVAKEAELLLLAVKHDVQRQGVGQLLLDHFTQVATNRGAEKLHLEVRDGNHAVKLYAKAGFVEVGRRKNYYTGCDGQIYDALTLAKAIVA